MATDSLPEKPLVNDEITEPEEKLEIRSADPTGASTSSTDAIQEKENVNPPPSERKFTLPSSLAWIPANLTWPRLKPVIRCALSAWVAIVFMIITRVAHPLGQVSTTSCPEL